MKTKQTTLSLAVVTLTAGLALSPTIASADASPFKTAELSSGYMQLAEGNCGGNMPKDSEGSCGGDKAKDTEASCGADMEDKAGEAKCGAEMEDKAGEAKCGAEMQEKMEEGKCGGDK